MMRVAVQSSGGSFKTSSPTRLFDGPNLVLDGRFAAGGTPRTYDIAPDGLRFLAIRLGNAADDEGTPQTGVVVIQNWLEELKATFAALPAR